jgi:hypothetical protein
MRKVGTEADGQNDIANRQHRKRAVGFFARSLAPVGRATKQQEGYRR